jgi:hypothetical protein
MPNTADTIKRLVDRAEECRVLAGIVSDRDAAASYLKLADTYELMAEQERRLSSWFAKSAPVRWLQP